MAIIIMHKWMVYKKVVGVLTFLLMDKNMMDALYRIKFMGMATIILQEELNMKVIGVVV